MKKKLLFVAVSIIVIAIVSYNYIYQDHRDIKNETAAFITSSKTLLSEFETNADAAQKKYLNQSIELTGIVTAKDETSITLNQSIYCSLNGNQYKTVKLNQNVTLKGRFIGYDDLLEEIKLDQSTLLKF